MGQTPERLGENARNPHRWESADEIYFCLQSIHNHAPWIRTIWVIVDGDAPDLTGMAQAIRAKVRIVSHEEIFAGYAHVLPTFNSIAIESMMWRIDGLAERFLYFNDDVFLTAPLTPQDVFDGVSPVLRGGWRDYSGLAADPAARDDPALFNHFMQINAAALCGLGADNIFAAAHAVHPMRRSIMAALFDARTAEFEANITPRFRTLAQFLPQAAHNHWCILADEAVFAPARDHLHIRSGQGNGEAPERTRGLLLDLGRTSTRMLCVNDLPQLEALVPDARMLIREAIGGGLVYSGECEPAVNSSKASSALAPKVTDGPPPI
tara:strand:- start:56881 stop:57846 length:966 start_codon:yes stop_codon:yes gene_type:complete